ncbi:hypothetical protein TVAG_390740 [Trichomonas vaginalis G3]|uniref:Uncharacterized protein n=1 Tax=Trichomonas vaginalis (strain ATCC PRA-98 / G3) TaxID=412133 RepID=A2FDY8_TRIV3|nr:hypothetical protein TVAGG3_0402220 [Trichomonas vaginalis G3]EAX96867.1 hypothetical protein TVAG_390740 [Trichomonas vaginalis G3]KAI5534785.1 hypothetical protein TVAGG3_0402220 [Trichomonas vaginalis G3]|eukprot:XP_001309797.1 hypothetical protein [Trichomonas vaginalis G3]
MDQELVQYINALGKQVDDLYNDAKNLGQLIQQDPEAAQKNYNAYNEIVNNRQNLCFLLMYSFKNSPEWERSLVRYIADFIEFRFINEPESKETVHNIVKFAGIIFIKTPKINNKPNVQEYIKLAHIASYKFRFHQLFFQNLNKIFEDFDNQSYRILYLIQIIGLGFANYFSPLYKILFHGITNLSGDIQLSYINYFIGSINTIVCSKGITEEIINKFIEIFVNSSDPNLTFAMIRLFTTINQYYRENRSSDEILAIAALQENLMEYVLNALTLDGALNEIDSILKEILFIVNENNYLLLFDENLIKEFINLCKLSENDLSSLSEENKIFEFYDGSYQNNRNYVLEILQNLSFYDFELIFWFLANEQLINEFPEECLFLISGLSKIAKENEDKYENIKEIISNILKERNDGLILINQIIIAGNYHFLYERNDIQAYFEYLLSPPDQVSINYWLASILSAFSASKYEQFYITYEMFVQIYQYCQETMDTTLEEKITNYLYQLSKYQEFPQENLIEFVSNLILIALSIPKNEEEKENSHVDESNPVLFEENESGYSSLFEEQRSYNSKLRLLFILVPFVTQQNFIDEMFSLYDEFFGSECSDILSTDQTPQFVYAAIRSPLFDFEEQFEKIQNVTENIAKLEEPSNQTLFMNSILMLKKIPESLIPYFKEKVSYYFDDEKGSAFEYHSDQLLGAMLISNSILQGIFTLEEALQKLQSIFMFENEEQGEEEEKNEELTNLRIYYSHLLVRSAYLLSIPNEEIQTRLDQINALLNECLEYLSLGIRFRNIDFNLIASAFKRFSQEEAFVNACNQYPPVNDPVADDNDLSDFYRFDNSDSIFHYIFLE